MSEGSINQRHPAANAKNQTLPRPLTLWDNTPEEEDREIEAFMERAWVDMDASLLPYD